MRTITHFIDGQSFCGESTRSSEVYDPNIGAVQAQLRLGTATDVATAVQSALAAFPAWAATNPQKRARVLFNFKTLVEAHMDDLAHLLSSEHGKVIADAKGDIQRGLDVIEFSCGIPHLQKGEYSQGAGPGIEVAKG